jgi:signal transduction histidine kinase
MSRFSAAFFGALITSGLAVGLVSERQAYGWDEPRLWVPDLAVAMVWLAAATMTWPRNRPVSMLCAAVGLTWLAANFVSEMSYVHRGPLLHLLIAYPALRPRTRLGISAVLTGYVAAAVWPLWRAESSGAVLAAGLLTAVAVERRAVPGGRAQRHRPALAAACALSLVLVGGAVARTTIPHDDAVAPALVSYDIGLIAVAVVLVLPLLRRREATVADLVVELDETSGREISGELARVLGDPDLQIGYWQPDEAAFVGVDGTLLRLPSASDRRATTYIDDNGAPFVVLVHDPAVAGDVGLRDAVLAATRLTAANAALREAVVAQIDELMASRRRLVVAAAEERKQLAKRLEHGPERCIAHMLSALDDDVAHDQQIHKAIGHLRQTIEDLHEVAAGLHPRELAFGLEPALSSLAERCPIPVELKVSRARFDADIEAALYFGCAEALSNVAKHAAATHVRVTVSTADGWVELTASDDGRGGAEGRPGSGLTGIADRFAALGGELAVVSDASGTTLTARLPATPIRSSETA